ncbi:MAG TPA: pantetheine-phosphate adenylyltransferase [Candidatus Woesearchaeota archaeon]|nr:pantetheine-phosphate adenylyltransferase [Candidatus Woesearchaeota archaeon]
MARGVYAGSFDPPTNGHLWLISKGVELFDELYVAAALNPDKKYDFSIEERVRMLKEITKEYPNTIVDRFEDLYLVDHAASVGAKYILRGIRTEEDYEYEYKMKHFNQVLNPEIESVFLMPPKELEDLSSSFVKGLIGPRGWEEVIRKLVPTPVYNAILEKYNYKRTRKRRA